MVTKYDDDGVTNANDEEEEIPINNAGGYHLCHSVRVTLFVAQIVDDFSGHLTERKWRFNDAELWVKFEFPDIFTREFTNCS